MTPHEYVKYHNGGMRISEYAIYANELTCAERVQTVQYLDRKWLVRNIFWSPGDSAVLRAALAEIGDMLEK